jgi:hypothetical protein
VFAEFERAMIQERVRAGLRRARSEGKQLGRPKIDPEIERAILADLRRKDGPGVRDRGRARRQRRHGAAHRARAVRSPENGPPLPSGVRTIGVVGPISELRAGRSTATNSRGVSCVADARRQCHSM